MYFPFETMMFSKTWVYKNLKSHWWISIMKIETPIFSIVIILLISGVIANEPNLDKIKLEKAALFSFAAYCPEQRLIQWNCHWCQKVQDRVRVVKTINDAEKQNFAYVAASDKYYIVSFRGTVKGIQNWISNLNATMVQFGNNLAKVHRGFYGTWQFYENDIYEALYDLERKEGKKPILVTGHSRGGAIASIAAIELARRGLDVEHLTFGQPRVGDTGFMRLFNVSQ